MTASVDYLPVWKRDAPVHERLYELAEIARKHPHRFKKWVIAYCDTAPEGLYTRYLSGDDTNTLDSLAVLEAAKQRIWHDTHRE